jgi:hypothetical protein
MQHEALRRSVRNPPVIERLDTSNDRGIHALNGKQVRSYSAKVFNLDNIPKSHAAAMKSDEAAAWTAAEDKEKQFLRDLKAYKVVKISDLPKGANVLYTSWRYAKKVKSDEAGRDSLVYRARLVAGGDRQRPGIDYDVDGKSSPVAHWASNRTVALIALEQGLNPYNLDSSVAYLNARLKTPQYVSGPKAARTRCRARCCCSYWRCTD